MFSPSILTSSA